MRINNADCIFCFNYLLLLLLLSLLLLLLLLLLSLARYKLCITEKEIERI